MGEKTQINVRHYIRGFQRRVLLWSSVPFYGMREIGRVRELIKQNNLSKKKVPRTFSPWVATQYQGILVQPDSVQVNIN